MDIVELLQSAGFITEAARDGMKILKNRSELKSLEKVLNIINSQNQLRLESISKFVKELDLENESDKIRLSESFRESISLERELNALVICLEGLKNVDEGKLSNKGIDKEFFNTFYERSKDITYIDLKATWAELLKIEIENPGTVNLGVMNTI